MTAKKIDRILLGLGALLILISFYQLFLSGQNEGSGVKLGRLTSTLSVVKTKNALALDWRDAASGLDVSENQLIYTDSNSSAGVEFDQGGALDIGENSLIKLSSGAAQGMTVSKGFIKARLENNRPMRVQMNGADYVLSGENADIQINLQNAKGELGVINGEVKVEAEGVKETLNTSTALEIDGKNITKKPIYFKSLLPEKNSIHYVGSDLTPVTFTWEPDEEANVLLSMRPGLSPAEKIRGNSGIQKELSEGLYYFKIESDKGTSLTSSFRLLKERAPEIYRPREGESVSVLEGQDVLLQWKGENIKYLVEWNDGEPHSKEANGSSTWIPLKSEGAFSWRVKILNEKRPFAVWSEWQNVQMKLVPMPAVPTDLIPNDVDYQVYDKPDESVEFLWKGPEIVEIEVIDPTGKPQVFSGERMSFTYKALLAGQYQWRARGVDQFLRKSAWTDYKTFTIEDLSAEKNAEGVQRIQLIKPDQSVTFNWKSRPGAVTVFELSKDKSFSQIIKKVESKVDSAKVSVPETGSYYWRSREYLPDGTFQVSEPKRVIIEPVAAPEKPEKLPDMVLPLEEFPTTTSFLEKIMNFLLPSAYAEDVKGVVKIDLPVKEEAKGYVVKIYKDPKLTELLFEEELKTKHFEWVNARVGTYYWQYAVIDFWDRKSLFSDPAKLVIEGELVPRPSKPKLLSPIRAVEVEQKDLILTWTPSENAIRYLAEISDHNDFKAIVAKRESLKTTAEFTQHQLSPKLYYWRIHAFNKKNKETLSNTGRFTLVPTLEKITIADQFAKAPFLKKWNSRAFLGWAPSMDNYTFKDGETGTISGTALNGVFVSGNVFRDKMIYSGELLRQTGKVFEGEGYLFQRLSLDGVYVFNQNPNHKIGVGLNVGQSSGQTYTITNNTVSGSSVSGLTYGPVLRNFLAINEKWEIQGKAQYLLGEIKQIDIGADAVRNMGNYLFLSGVSYGMRTYDVSSGSQSSIRISLGFGKEF